MLESVGHQNYSKHMITSKMDLQICPIQTVAVGRTKMLFRVSSQNFSKQMGWDGDERKER